MGFKGDRISHKNGCLWKPSFSYHYQSDRSASRASSPGPGATGNSRQMGQIRFAPIPLMKLTHCNWHRHTGNLISSCCFSRAFWPLQLRHLFRVNSSTYWRSWSTARPSEQGWDDDSGVLKLLESHFSRSSQTTQSCFLLYLLCDYL